MARLATTSIEGLVPLGSAAQRSHRLIAETLRPRLGEDAAFLFAEPVAAQDGTRIDWFSPRPGRSQRLTALPPVEAAAVRERLVALEALIRAEAARIAGLGTEDAARLAEALTNALSYPGDAAVHAVFDAAGTAHPVLVSWAHVPAGREAVAVPLTGLDTRRPPPVPAPAAPAVPAAPAAPAALPASPAGAAAEAGFLLPMLLGAGWLVLEGMVAAILALMVAPCALSRPGVGLCPALPAVVEPDRRLPALEAEIAALERALAGASAACQSAVPLPLPAPAPVPPAVPAEAPVDPPANDIARRVEDRGGAAGALSFSLAWNALDDLDLVVTCPTGATINYIQRSACGGTLDIDANYPPQRATRDPVENVVFETAQPGTYIVRVRLYATTGGARPFSLLVREAGRPDRRIEGTVTGDRREWSQSFEIGGSR